MVTLTKSKYIEPKKPKKCRLALSTRDRWIPVVEKTIRKRKYGDSETCPLCQETGIVMDDFESCRNCICKYWVISLGWKDDGYDGCFCDNVFQEGLSHLGKPRTFSLSHPSFDRIIRTELKRLLTWLKKED